MVGHSEGQRFFKLAYSNLPQTQGRKITDPELAEAELSLADYLWAFYVRRKADRQAFTIRDWLQPLDPEAVVSVKFSEPKLSYNLFIAKFYSSGLLLHEWRGAVVSDC